MANFIDISICTPPPDRHHRIERLRVGVMYMLESGADGNIVVSPLSSVRSVPREAICTLYLAKTHLSIVRYVLQGSMIMYFEDSTHTEFPESAVHVEITRSGTFVYRKTEFYIPIEAFIAAVAEKENAGTAEGAEKQQPVKNGVVERLTNIVEELSAE